jgi:Na+/citrate or Na+/malate symporter
MSQDCDVLVPEHGDAVLVQKAPVRLFGLLVSLLGVLQSLPAALLPGFMILFVMGFGGATVGVRGNVMQFGGPLMVLVMRSVVITSGHLETHYLP